MRAEISSRYCAKLAVVFDVKQLRVLRAVAEHGSFSAAADALSYTQPAISQVVRPTFSDCG